MLAVIKTGGKQYLVQPGTKIKIEKLDKKEGSEITFNEVLLLEKNKKVEIGTPLVKDAKVIGKVLRSGCMAPDGKGMGKFATETFGAVMSAYLEDPPAIGRRLSLWLDSSGIIHELIG